ncbi:MAG: hypothetical protein VB119_07985 [Candidatus Metalachnospira sp.]|nr:hypothetical protein [Candidatus Metalachnospira sp.]
MNKEDLYSELGNIDPKYIEEADQNPNSRHIKWKRYSAIAAVLVLAVAIADNSDYVQAAIKKIFSFVPGVAITEEEKSSVLYSMDGEPQTQSNGKITFTVNNAYVTNYSIDVAWEISMDFIDEDKIKVDTTAEELNKIIEENGASAYLKAADDKGSFGPYIETTVDIKAGDETFSVPIKSGGGSLTKQNCISGIDYIPDLIKEYGVNTPITVTICGMSFDIKLKPIEYYESIDEIGPTVLKNNISLTAMPTWSDNALRIKMYSLNYSDFSQVYGYCDDYNNDETRPYLMIGGKKIVSDPIDGDGTEFSFNLEGYKFTEQDKAEAKIHMPVILMLNQEDVTFDIKVNKDGTVKHPDKVSFKYSDINIVSMKVGAQDWPDCIQMEYTISDNTDKIKMSSFSVSSVNGRLTGGMSSWTETQSENGILMMAFQHDDTPIKDYKTVTLSSPNYLITDEYVFNLN